MGSILQNISRSIGFPFLHDRRNDASCSYTNLDPVLREIRVLSLQPGNERDAIRCLLSVKQLSDKGIEYDALSWTWGNPSEPKAVISVNDEAHSIPPNLLAALRVLRRPDRPSTLWIDCICINQSDAIEKAVQISLMGDIYAKARRVLVWLGSAANDSEMVMDAIRQSPEAEYRTIKFFHAMQHLETRPWFFRVWILQEMAISARPPLLFCGGGEPICWDCFMHANQTAYAGEIERIRAFIHPEKTMGQSSAGIAQTRFSEAERRDWETRSGRHRLTLFADLGFPTTLSRLRDTYQQSTINTLSGALEMSSRSKSTELRDRIYGVLGLIRADLRENFTAAHGVSYDKREKADWDVYQDTAMWMLANEKTGVLQIFDWFALDPGVGDVPSWVPNFAFARNLNREVLHHEYWQVHKDTDWRPTIHKHSHRLLTKGIELDVVENVVSFGTWTEAPRVINLNSVLLLLALFLFNLFSRIFSPLEAWRATSTEVRQYVNLVILARACHRVTELVDAKHGTGSLPEPLWRTLLGRKTSSTNMADKHFEALEKLYRDYNPATWTEATDTETAISGNAAASELELGVSRMFFFACRGGVYGMSNAPMESGDRVVVLFPGVWAPFVVRGRGEDVRM